MNCRDVRSLLARYVDGDVDGYEQTLIEHHLTTCKPCAVAVSELKVTHRRVQREIKSWAASRVPSSTARQRLMATIADGSEPPTQAACANNPVDNSFARRTVLLRHIAFATLVTLVIAALIALLLGHVL